MLWGEDAETLGDTGFLARATEVLSSDPGHLPSLPIVVWQAVYTTIAQTMALCASNRAHVDT